MQCKATGFGMIVHAFHSKMSHSRSFNSFNSRTASNVTLYENILQRCFILLFDDVDRTSMHVHAIKVIYLKFRLQYLDLTKAYPQVLNCSLSVLVHSIENSWYGGTAYTSPKPHAIPHFSALFYFIYEPLLTTRFPFTCRHISLHIYYQFLRIFSTNKDSRKRIYLVIDTSAIA